MPEENSIEIKNRFKVLMDVQEEVSPDEMANYTSVKCISTAKIMLQIKSPRYKYIYQTKLSN